MIIRKRQSDK